MSGASGGDVSVTTWGWYTDESGTDWQRWAVQYKGRRRCFLELPQDVDAVDALICAGALVDENGGNAAFVIRAAWDRDAAEDHSSSGA